MSQNELLKKVGRAIKRELFGPYLPPEYEEFYNEPGGNSRISTLFAPFRLWRDRRFFLKHLHNTDLFLVGHPKSGNTWLAYMLAIMLQKDTNNQINLANIRDRAPIIHGRDSKIALYQELSSPRLFRTEWPVYPEVYPKVIYLIRDPRAVLVSYYHMYRIWFDNSEVTLGAFVEEYLANGYIRDYEPLERWDKQVLTWLERSRRGNRVILVKYEDMILDRRNVLKRILDFAQMSYSEKILDIAVERGSFEAMRAIEDKHGAESYPGEIGKRGKFIRKGKRDGWKEEMDRSIVNKIEIELAPAMKALGYLF